MSAEKHQGASLEGMFPKLTPEQEARLRPVTEKDVLLSPEEAAALSEEERVEMETMRWKQVPPSRLGPAWCRGHSATAKRQKQNDQNKNCFSIGYNKSKGARVRNLSAGVFLQSEKECPIHSC